MCVSWQRYSVAEWEICVPSVQWISQERKCWFSVVINVHVIEAIEPINSLKTSRLIQGGSIEVLWNFRECGSKLREKNFRLGLEITKLSGKKWGLKVHSHWAKAEAETKAIIISVVCRLFFDLFCMSFDLFRFRSLFSLVWMDPFQFEWINRFSKRFFFGSRIQDKMS